jgi:hypothetical protein
MAAAWGPPPLAYVPPGAVHAPPGYSLPAPGYAPLPRRAPHPARADRRSHRVRPYALTGRRAPAGIAGGPMLGDLAEQGRIRVYGTAHGSVRPDRALLERVLSGLRRL